MTHFEKSYSINTLARKTFPFSRHKKYQNHHKRRHIYTMPSTTSSADGPAKKRPSAKEELERTMRRHETHADHVARDLGTRLHFPSSYSFCVFTTKISLSLSLCRLSIKKLSAGKTRRKKSPNSPPRSFLASTEAF